WPVPNSFPAAPVTTFITRVIRGLEDLLMIKLAHFSLVAFMCLGSAGAFADACYVTIDSSLAGPTGAREETCFEHRGAPAGSLDWSCKSDKDVQGASREKRDSCPSGFFGKCTAELTQEALANEKSAGQKS